MRRLIARFVASLVVLGAVAVGFGVPASGQTDPDSSEVVVPEAFLAQYAWWNKTQQVPGTSPVPKPPTAPDDGIYIAYEATAPTVVTGPVTGGGLPTPPATVPGPTPGEQVTYPTAFGAVRFGAPDGAEGRLTLTLTARSATTPGNVDPRVGPVLACLATSAWDPVQNGRFEGAPSYDCSSAASVTIAGDQLVFEVPGNLQVGGYFDLVLVPIGTQPFSMGIKAPTSDSFVITNADDLMAAYGDEPAYDDSYESPLTDIGSTFFAPTDTFIGDTALGDTTSTTGAPAVNRPSVALARPINNPLGKDATRAERIAAVSLLLLLASALWWFGGNQVRPPHLLGSMGARQAALVPVGAVPRSAPIGGIGRFARPRVGTAPKL